MNKLLVTIFLCLFVIAITAALPLDEGAVREKRDVMDSIKNASDEVAKTMTDAGDAVVQAFKPTEKSVADKIADGLKNV